MSYDEVRAVAERRGVFWHVKLLIGGPEDIGIESAAHFRFTRRGAERTAMRLILRERKRFGPPTEQFEVGP